VFGHQEGHRAAAVAKYLSIKNNGEPAYSMWLALF